MEDGGLRSAPRSALTSGRIVFLRKPAGMSSLLSAWRTSGQCRTCHARRTVEKSTRILG